MTEEETRTYPDRISSLESHTKGLETKIESISEGQKMLFAKVDSLASMVQGLAGSSGRVSAGMVMTLIGTITPIIIAAAALGHVFVKSENSRLTDRIQGNAATSTMIMDVLTEQSRRNAEFIDRLNTSRHTSSDQLAFLAREFDPLVARERMNALAISRLQGQWEQVSRQLDDHLQESDHPYGVLVELERLRAEMNQKVGER